MKPAPKRVRPPKVKKRLKPRRKKFEGDFWSKRSKECIRKMNGWCFNHAWLVEATDAAHVHELGRGRSRHNPDATCSTCGTRLNDLANLVATCRTCNALVTRRCPGKKM